MDLLQEITLASMFSLIGGASGLIALLKVGKDWYAQKKDETFQLKESLQKQVDSLTGRVEHLEQEVKLWRDKYYDLKQINNQIAHSNELLRHQNEQLEQRNKALQEEIEHLKHQITRFEKYFQRNNIDIEIDEGSDSG